MNAFNAISLATGFDLLESRLYGEPCGDDAGNSYPALNKGVFYCWCWAG